MNEAFVFLTSLGRDSNGNTLNTSKGQGVITVGIVREITVKPVSMSRVRSVS